MRKLSHKIVIVTLLSCVLITLIMGSVFVNTIMKSNEQKASALEKTLKSNLDLLIKTEVESAVSMLQDLYNKSEKGEITLEQAKKLGADILRNMRYGIEGYFWADTTEGINVVLLGKKDVEGTNRYDTQDVKGIYHIHAIISNGMKEGGGYSDYWFPKKDSTKPLPKRSYSLQFKPFGWVIGTGNYVDDIDVLIAKEKAKYKDEMIKDLINAFVFYGIGIVIVAITVAFLGMKLTYSIVRVTQILRSTANFDLNYDRSLEPLLKSKDETGKMANALNDMRVIFSSMISTIKDISGKLNTQSQLLTASANENTSMVTQVVTTINEIAESNNNQAEAIHKTNQTFLK